MATQSIERQRSQLWGPPLEKTHNLPTSAKFTGEDLVNMDKDIRANSHLSSEGIVNFLAKKMNMRLAIFALTALNQFYIKEVNLRDINSVTIVQDTQNKARMGEGRGQGHIWYLIDWIKAPESKPDPATIQTSNIKQKQVSAPYRFMTQADRDAARRTRDTRDERRRRENERREKERREVEEIERTIFDIGKEAGDNAVNNNLVRVDVKDGVARVYIKQYGFQKEFHELNMDNGVFEGVWEDEKWQIGAELLRYMAILAKKAEGEDVSYTPRPLTYNQCEIAYELALKHGKIAQMKDTNGNIVFIYQDSRELSSLYFSTYQTGNVDLERGLVVTRPESIEGRPLHPDFVDFLKKKKIELGRSSTQMV